MWAGLRISIFTSLTEAISMTKHTACCRGTLLPLCGAAILYGTGREGFKQRAPTFIGDLSCRLFDRAIATDGFRKRGEFNRDTVIVGRQFFHNFLERLFIVGEQTPLEFAILAVTERVEKRSPQNLGLGKEGEQTPQPGPVALLDWAPGNGIDS